jgi:prevent-host-death family protein
MSTITASNARRRLNRLIADAADTHQPIVITGGSANAVLISEADWTAIQDTLHLVAIPRMRASIVAGMKTPVATCAKTLRW